MLAAHKPLSQADMVAEPAYAVEALGMVGRHDLLARTLVGAWRWPLVHAHRDALLEILSNPLVVDFGGASGPIGYGSVIVDPLAPVPTLCDLRGEVDAIFASHVLEHMADLRLCLQMMHAKLGQGGVLAVQVPGPAQERLRRANWPYHEVDFRLADHDDPGCVVLEEALGEFFQVDGAVADKSRTNLFAIARKV